MLTHNSVGRPSHNQELSLTACSLELLLVGACSMPVHAILSNVPGFNQKLSVTAPFALRPSRACACAIARQQQRPTRQSLLQRQTALPQSSCALPPVHVCCSGCCLHAPACMCGGAPRQVHSCPAFIAAGTPPLSHEAISVLAFQVSASVQSALSAAAAAAAAGASALQRSAFLVAQQTAFTGCCQLVFELVAHNKAPQHQPLQHHTAAAVAEAAASESPTAADLWQQLAALQLPGGLRVLQVQVEEQQLHLAAPSPEAGAAVGAAQVASHPHGNVALIPATICLPSTSGSKVPAVATELHVSKDAVGQLLQHSPGGLRVVVAAQPSGTLLLDNAQQQQAAALGTSSEAAAADGDADVLLQLELDAPAVAAAVAAMTAAAGAALVCSVAVLSAADDAGNELEAASEVVDFGRTAPGVMLLPLLLLPEPAHQEMLQLLAAAGKQHGMSSKQAYSWLLPLLQDFALLLQWEQQGLQLKVQQELYASVSVFFAANGMVECRKLLWWHGQQQQQ